jgi:hypothetical protein
MYRSLIYRKDENLDGSYEEKENYNNYSGNMIASDAALKLNYDKKVRFAEQLGFKLDQMTLFKNEEPMPIEFKNN